MHIKFVCVERYIRLDTPGNGGIFLHQSRMDMAKKAYWILFFILLQTAIGIGIYYYLLYHQTNALYEQAQNAYQRQDYPQSLALCRKIISGWVRLLPELKQANVLINAGNCLYEMEKYTDSIDYFARAAEIVEKHNLLSQIDAPSWLYARWGDSLKEKQEDANAEKIYQHGIELFRVVYGMSYPGIAMLQVRLGKMYLYNEEYSKSLVCLESAVANRFYIREQNGLNKAYLYGNLAAAYCHNNKLNEANAMYIQSIDLMKKCFGDKSAHLAIEYSGLALVRYKQKKFMEAIKFLDLAYDIFLEQKGCEYHVTRIAKLREEWKQESQK